MSTQTRVVRLLQNTLYPTYQLHATMSNKQTPLQRGFVLWCLPLWSGCVSALERISPKSWFSRNPNDIRKQTYSCLPSLHIHRGYVVDIVSLPSQGVWSLQITDWILRLRTRQPRSTAPGCAGAGDSDQHRLLYPG